MSHQITNEQRFLVRAKENRNLIAPQCNLTELLKTTQGQCCYTVNVKQRGGRKARKAQMTLSYQPITFAKPKRAQGWMSLTLILSFAKKKRVTKKVRSAGSFTQQSQSIRQNMLND